MTKAELIDKMAKDADISKAAAGKALDSFIDGVKKTLKKGDKVGLVGFGLSRSPRGKRERAGTRRPERSSTSRQARPRSSPREKGLKKRSGKKQQDIERKKGYGKAYPFFRSTCYFRASVTES